MNSQVFKDNITQKQNKFSWATEQIVKDHKTKTINKIVGKKVLDIGCHDVYDAFYYCQYASFYCGVDTSNEAIKIAKKLKLKNAEFLRSNGHYINKEDGEFDCIIVSYLRHQLDFKKLLIEIKRLLKPGGTPYFRINPWNQFYYPNL